jgi:hypothetical protein
VRVNFGIPNKCFHFKKFVVPMLSWLIQDAKASAAAVADFFFQYKLPFCFDTSKHATNTLLVKEYTDAIIGL